MQIDRTVIAVKIIPVNSGWHGTLFKPSHVVLFCIPFHYGQSIKKTCIFNFLLTINAI